MCAEASNVYTPGLPQQIETWKSKCSCILKDATDSLIKVSKECDDGSQIQDKFCFVNTDCFA